MTNATKELFGRAGDPENQLAKLNIKSLRVFVTVCETGSYAAAGQELHLSQPSISGHISRLELLLGVQLFKRHRKIHITPHTQKVYEISREIHEKFPHPLPRMNLDILQTFIATAFSRHISMSSEIMCIGVSTTINRINMMERSTGLCLFKRNKKKGYRLTIDGYLILRKSIKVILLVDKIDVYTR